MLHFADFSDNLSNKPFSLDYFFEVFHCSGQDFRNNRIDWLFSFTILLFNHSKNKPLSDFQTSSCQNSLEEIYLLPLPCEMSVIHIILYNAKTN